ncbi:hypothetical protein ACFCYC_07755 [Streptomyces sp. NPDC056402]|uniref:hypothetical protein n=1 Tax=Streptomyces sp. NPDC056402 TaxID=3345810 RepID=UPI0035DCB033
MVTAALGEPSEVTVEEPRSWPRPFAYDRLGLSVCRCQEVILICLQTWRDVVRLPAGRVGREASPGEPGHADVPESLARAVAPGSPTNP